MEPIAKRIKIDMENAEKAEKADQNARYEALIAENRVIIRNQEKDIDLLSEKVDFQQELACREQQAKLAGEQYLACLARTREEHAKVIEELEKEIEKTDREIVFKKMETNAELNGFLASKLNFEEFQRCEKKDMEEMKKADEKQRKKIVELLESMD